MYIGVFTHLVRQRKNGIKNTRLVNLIDTMNNRPMKLRDIKRPHTLTCKQKRLTLRNGLEISLSASD